MLKKILGPLFINSCLINAKLILCTSQLEKDFLQFFGNRRDNVTVLALPVDYKEGLNGCIEDFRVKYNIDKNEFVFLFLSRINYKKGLDKLLEALYGIIYVDKKMDVKIRLVIAGDIINNEYVNVIEKMILQYNLSDKVIFTGMLTGLDKANAYAGSNVFILPSMNENFGLAIIEALQSGLPVIISKNVYIYKELFSEDSKYPGWLCETNLRNLKEIMLDAIVCTEDKKNVATEVGNQYRSSNLLEKYSNMYIK